MLSGQSRWSYRVAGVYTNNKSCARRFLYVSEIEDGTRMDEMSKNKKKIVDLSYRFTVVNM